MKIKTLTRSLTLTNVSKQVYIEGLYEYLSKAPSKCSPGNDEYVDGKVNKQDHTFILYSFPTWKRTYLGCTCYGRLFTDNNGRENILLDFKSSIIGAICTVLFFAFPVYLFWEVEGRSIVIIASVSLFILSLFGEIRFIKKMSKRHIAFLKLFDSKNNMPKWK